MAKTEAPSATVTFKLKLPESLYDAYAERATKHGRDVEEEILMRLRDCRLHTASASIYLNDDERQELSRLASRLIRTPRDIINLVSSLVTLKVSQVEIPLSQQLITRLESRRFGAEWPVHIRRVVTESLEQFAGLR